MATNAESTVSHADRQWFIVGRWQEYEGEARANLLRIVGVGAFYIVELINYCGVNLGPIELPAVVDKSFHQAVTALAVAWTMVGMAVLYCQSRRFFPWTLKFISTALDLVLLTAVLVVADGPKSPLMVGYFLLIALSTLRFNLPLVRATTAGAMLCYLFLLGYARWFTERDVTVPRYHQLIVLLALGLTGIIVGQVIRRVRELAQQYAARVSEGQGGPST